MGWEVRLKHRVCGSCQDRRTSSTHTVHSGDQTDTASTSSCAACSVSWLGCCCCCILEPWVLLVRAAKLQLGVLKNQRKRVHQPSLQ